MRTWIVAAAVFALSSVAQGQLYSTAPYDPQLAFASDGVPGQFNNQRLAEVFVIGAPSHVGSFRWWGRSEGAFFPNLANMESFQIRVYNDGEQLPGPQIYAASVPVSAVNPVVVEVDPQGRNIYRFDHFIPGGLVLLTGNYWLSVGTDNFNPEGDGFFWQASQQTISDNFAADGGVNGTWNPAGFADLALEVHAVPEPATLAALGLGFAALLRRRRRA